MAQVKGVSLTPSTGWDVGSAIGEGAGPLVVERNGLVAAQGPLFELLTVARGEMAGLYRQTAAWGRGVLLADRDGHLINAIGEPCLLARLTGADSTPPGTEGAPIFDAWGEPLALLDAPLRDDCPGGQAATHVRALVVRSALAIGNAHFRHRFRAHHLLCFHLHPEGLGLPGEGLLALDGDDCVLAANPGALGLLGRSRSELLGRSLTDLLCPEPGITAGSGLNLRDARGRRHWARREAPLPGILPPPRLTLEQLQGSDPLMAYNVRCARRVVARSIPLLLQGEPGSGRETFARALHRAGPRRERSFVVMDCSGSLDWETLVIPGGIGREGMRERLTAARGGTLFLREVGELPPSLQARLLQALRDEADTLDLHLISATRCHLTDLTALELFREDLYYHLNGLTLNLPALRERPDRQTLIADLLASRYGDSLVLEEAALADLAARPWPGNLQQLGEVLERAVAHCQGGVLRRDDLPGVEVSRAGSQPGGGVELSGVQATSM